MKNFVFLFLLLITGSCSVNPFVVKPEDVSRNEGSDLLEFRAAYTIVETDGKSRTVYRVLTHTFDNDCRLTERRQVYTENRFAYSTERTVYTYNKAGLLTMQQQYEAYQLQPERLMDQITYAYDTQGRLISQNYQNSYVSDWKFEYIDDKKQVNRYSCINLGGNCVLSTITIDGKRTYPESSYRANEYISSSYTPYGNRLYETVNAKGNRVLVEVYDEYKKKTLLERITYTYDARRAFPLGINDADFTGYPADDQDRPGNNEVQSDHYTYDQATGAVRQHIRSNSQYTYNRLGYPTWMKMEENNVLTGKPTGVRTVITVHYGCGN